MRAGRRTENGRRTEAYLVTHPPSTGSPSSASSARFLNLSVGELASVIFACSHATLQECVSQLIFGMPHHHFSYIKNIQPGMPLFLFNYSDRKLHGIFEADGCAELNINPYAWTNGKGKKTSYPAQVRVRLRCRCLPLPEKVFKEAIAANYCRDPSRQSHFSFELNRVQTDMLLSLFTRNPTSVNSRRVNSEAGPSSRVTLGAGPSSQPQGDEEGWFELKKAGRSTMDAWHNAEPFMATPAQTSAAQGEERSATQEQWDDCCEYNADQRTAGNGSPDSENSAIRSLEPKAEKFLDWGSDVQLSNVKMSEGEEDCGKLEDLEKQRQVKQKGNMQSNVEVKAQIPEAQDRSQGETSGSGSTDSTKVQEFALVEREKLSCFQERILREEREQLREKIQTSDVSVAKPILKDLELSESAITQMRQDEIKLRHVMYEAFSQEELLRELDQVKKKNATLEEKNAILEYTQVQMALELEALKSDVTRMSEQQEALSRLVSQIAQQSGNSCVDQTGSTVAREELHGDAE